MNQTASTQRVEYVNSSYSPTAVEQSERSHYDAECSRYLATQTVFKDITETLGTTFVPDLFAALERNPAYLEAAWELFKDEVGLDALDACTRHIVALAITTNRRGTYLITAFPHAFYLSPVGPRRCESIVSTIRMFQAFDRYLSDLEPARCQKPETLGTTSVPPTQTPRRLK
ncbi:MAG TPA: hypothetical protein DEA71_16925 [Nitrospira sp.]|nr:hypothetical protein [Nitrospira sp.]